MKGYPKRDSQGRGLEIPSIVIVGESPIKVFFGESPRRLVFIEFTQVPRLRTLTHRV